MFQITVQAIDGGSPPLRDSTVVQVNVIRNNPPVVTPRQDSIRIDRNTPEQEVVHSFEASDNDIVRILILALVQCFFTFFS